MCVSSSLYKYTVQAQESWPCCQWTHSRKVTKRLSVKILLLLLLLLLLASCSCRASPRPQPCRPAESARGLWPGVRWFCRRAGRWQGCISPERRHSAGAAGCCTTLGGRRTPEEAEGKRNRDIRNVTRHTSNVSIRSQNEIIQLPVLRHMWPHCHMLGHLHAVRWKVGALCLHRLWSAEKWVLLRRERRYPDIIYKYSPIPSHSFSALYYKHYKQEYGPTGKRLSLMYN